MTRANELIHRLYSYAWEPARKQYEENAKILNQELPKVTL